MRGTLPARLFGAVLAASVAAGPARAVDPDEMLADPAKEARAREISSGLRCLVCQNQSIDDSNAGLARDLRLLVRERIMAGDSDEEVVGFVVDRYGEFVLLEPRMTAKTLALWFAPALLLVAGGAVVAIMFRRSRPKAEAPLDAEEERRLAEVLARTSHNDARDNVRRPG